MEKNPSRTWFFENGTFLSPEWKQQGNPFQINRAIKEQWLNSLPKVKPLNLRDKIKAWLDPQAVPTTAKAENLSSELSEKDSERFFEELEKNDREQENRDLEETEEE